MSALHALATAVGLQIGWIDAAGRSQTVADEALEAVLGALGFSAGSAAAIDASREKLAVEEEAGRGFLSADAGEPTRLPACYGRVRRGELILEDGDRRDLAIEAGLLPPIAETGYHRLALDGREIRLAVAPRRCFRVADAAPGKRVWGPSVQISALRDGRAQPYGDFGTLAAAAGAFAASGADALAISPVHALFPADPGRYSPYAPSSRLFLNVLYADPSTIGESLPPQHEDELIAWPSAIPARMRLLREVFDRRSDGVAQRLRAYREGSGDALERHARFDALHAHFFASGARGWQDWPAAFHDPGGAAVARFAAAHAEDVAFYAWLQWLAKLGLDRAQAAATGAGMTIGLIADLAVGMDVGGSHAWSRRDELLTGLSIGAPPDLLGPDGQGWGITGFSPHALRRTGFDGFIATLRAALGHAGGIRIDHALGLRRLWVVPDGASPAGGAYLTYPMEDMLRLLALESRRARAIVVGEDLGTVPEGLRPAMDAKAMLGMRVLWFERDEAGGFVPPGEWPADAAAMTSTHDLPSVAGWWCGRDIEWTWALGRTSKFADEAEEEVARASDRAKLWEALGDAGAPAPAPDTPEPVIAAALAFVGRTPCALAIVPAEDLAGLVEQPNLPGTIDEHPNWRRRMPAPTDALLARPDIAERIATLNAARAA